MMDYTNITALNELFTTLETDNSILNTFVEGCQLVGRLIYPDTPLFGFAIFLILAYIVLSSKGG